MKKNVLLLLALAALLGCSKSEHLSDNDADGLSIQLSGRINDRGATRAGVVEGTLPAAGTTLSMGIFRAGYLPDVKREGLLLGIGKVSCLASGRSPA
jgi:hypothetical protein